MSISGAAANVLIRLRLDGLVPGTPATRKLNKSAIKRGQMETPSISRVKTEHASSSPDHKTPSKTEDQGEPLGAMP